MNRFLSVLKDAWWVWILLIGGGTAAGYFLSPIFFMALPISCFTFVYFALIRYDEDGKPKSGL